MSTDPKTTPLAYLERRVSDVLRGTPVRDLDEAFSAVRMQIDRLRAALREIAAEPFVHCEAGGIDDNPFRAVALAALGEDAPRAK